VTKTHRFLLLKEFVSFVNERYDIHVRRSSGAPPPWTKDPVLGTYRFTNVRREDDRVTKRIHAEWLRPHSAESDLWFAAYVARVFNKPATLDAIGWPVPWSRPVQRRVTRALLRLKLTDQRIFNAAYIVSSHGRKSASKADYYMEIFTELWKNRASVRPKEGDSLGDFMDRLTAQEGIGGFMGAQVIADVKHFSPLSAAIDWWPFARSGPGSRRGMSWLLSGGPYERLREEEWYGELTVLSATIKGKLHCEPLDAQNLQNCLCEFSKWCKVKYLAGRAKQKFTPSKETY